MYCILNYDISNLMFIIKNDYIVFELNKLNKFVFIILLKYNFWLVKNLCLLI